MQALSPNQTARVIAAFVKGRADQGKPLPSPGEVEQLTAWANLAIQHYLVLQAVFNDAALLDLDEGGPIFKFLHSLGGHFRDWEANAALQGAGHIGRN